MTEMETYSGYTAYQLATAAAPMLAHLLVDLGAQVRPLPLDKMSSSDGEDDLSDGSDQYMMPSWRISNDQQKVKQYFASSKMLHHLLIIAFFNCAELGIDERSPTPGCLILHSHACTFFKNFMFYPLIVPVS